MADITEPQYGDKVKLERQKQGAPLERVQPVAARPSPVASRPAPVEPAAPGSVPVHTQKHLWGANYFVKKANEVRPGVAGLDEIQSNKLFATNMAIQIADLTNDPDMYALAEEIMDRDDSPYDFYSAIAAAQMDDIEIAEGRWQGGNVEQPGGSGKEVVQTDADNGQSESNGSSQGSKSDSEDRVSGES